MNGDLPMGADARLEAASSDGSAEALLWWTRVPELPNERIGVIGGFKATSATATADVLRRAVTQLAAQGCTLAAGPMDGNTWRRYRFVTEAGTEPPFLLEPTNPPDWPDWWQAKQFTPLANFYSALTEDLAVNPDWRAGVATRVAADGIRIRPLDPARYEEELALIYEVSVVSFQQNYLYTPLPREDFIAQYRAVQSKVRPELVLLAEREGKPVGYMFAVPDYAAAQRGAPVDTVIMKTLAVLPNCSHAGLGGLLFSEAHAAAQRLGFKRAIHALMHEANRSRKLSAHSARIFRRYTLFGRRLGP